MEKSKFLSLISKLFATAKKDNWKPSYNKEVDSFYWTKPKISNTARLVQFIDEFSLYVTPSGKIEGLTMEYARFNFMSHHKEFRPLFNAMTSKGKTKTYTIPKNKKSKVEHLLENMADKVARDTLELIADNKINIEDLLKV